MGRVGSSSFKLSEWLSAKAFIIAEDLRSAAMAPETLGCPVTKA